MKSSGGTDTLMSYDNVLTQVSHFDLMNSDDKVVVPDCVMINCACMSVTESEITFLYTVNLVVETSYLQGIVKHCVPVSML